ncbi:CatB-related O-acetyltransferase [Tessaracoccus rhinocerotis]|uniref:CatB-related O-acetyltransferase n=1 Tax=Tessaracoccus rhinocerotis TaxID=1689449 RepID=A0A553K1P5_9ACTN|nr:CatB-related O-acetyltransferase [Tessaracoccus rhinocerotis]TRY18628.1 CatB-related O-acetyltransferase [Tessaracoccus rhinocerotis]
MSYNRVLVRVYAVRRRSVRRLVVRICRALEGGEMTSKTLREIFRRFHDVDVGMYSHGGCFELYAFGPKTTIGRYSSIARGAFAATLDHPTGRKSMHGYFFNPRLGLVSDELSYSPLRIGNDVWMGYNSIIHSSVNEIGDGAVIGAGAVVFKDVPPYAVVVGNPGRVVRYRFDEETITRLLAERWWEKDLEELDPAAMMTPHMGIA